MTSGKRKSGEKREVLLFSLVENKINICCAAVGSKRCETADENHRETNNERKMHRCAEARPLMCEYEFTIWTDLPCMSQSHGFSPSNQTKHNEILGPAVPSRNYENIIYDISRMAFALSLSLPLSPSTSSRFFLHIYFLHLSFTLAGAAYIRLLRPLIAHGGIRNDTNVSVHHSAMCVCVSVRAYIVEYHLPSIYAMCVCLCVSQSPCEEEILFFLFPFFSVSPSSSSLYRSRNMLCCGPWDIPNAVYVKQVGIRHEIVHPTFHFLAPQYHHGFSRDAGCRSQ